MLRYFSAANPTTPSDIAVRPKRPKSRVILLAVVIVGSILIVAFVAFSFLGNQMQTQGVSIANASMSWQYNEFSRGYICIEVKYTLTNHGNEPTYDLNVYGEIDGQTFYQLVSGSGFSVVSLRAGEARSIVNQWVGVTIQNSGSYTLTLRVENNMREVLGQSSFNVHIP